MGSHRGAFLRFGYSRHVLHPSVVRVVVSRRTYDYDAPWTVEAESPSYGTGVIIAPGRVLTTANLAANAVALHVQHAGAGDRAAARVISIDHDRDLALLELFSRAELFAGVAPAEIGSSPAVGDELDMVAAASLDAGPSLLRGTVAKLDSVRYVHSQRHLPALTVDVGIGNHHEAGPGFVDGKLVGLANQKPTDAENVCDLVPTPLIVAFLQGAKRGLVSAVPSLGISVQNLEHPHLRAHLGQDAGVVVTNVAHGESADGVLRRGDVLVGVGGRPLTRTGKLELLDAWLRYDAVLALHHPGDRLRVDFVRDRQRLGADLTLTPWQPLVPRARYDQPPHYVVYAGLLFQSLTRDYLTTWDEWWNKGPKEFLQLYYSGRRTPAQHEVVILTNILADEATRGYEHLYNEAVSAIDGHLPRDLSDFAGRLARARGTVQIDTTSGGVIVLDVEEAQRATARVLDTYAIPADRTAGLPS